jgi:hypothetical protein
MRLVGLRNEAAAAIEQTLYSAGQAGIRAGRQVADEIWGRVASEDDLAGFDKLRWTWLRLLGESAGAKHSAQHPPGLSHPRMNHSNSLRSFFGN